MTPLGSRLAIRAHELLRDGQWHSWDRTVAELIKLVPPGIAIRRNERERVFSSRKNKGEVTPRVRPRSPDQLIHSGARAIVRDHLNTRRLYESQGIGRDRQVRMRNLPRAVEHANTELARISQLSYDVMVLRDQVRALSKYLIEIGHGEAVQRIAPDAYRNGDEQ